LISQHETHKSATKIINNRKRWWR